jgi:hypothetical protein
MGDTAWRPVAAALSHPDALRLYAEIVLGTSADAAGAALSPSRRRHAIDGLRRAGLIDEDGIPVFDVFSRMLQTAPRVERPTGVARFLTPDGRIDRYPSAAGEYEELLRHVLVRVLARGEVVDERTLTTRLASWSDDPVGLRRRLVDRGLVERTPTGSEYAIVEL